MWKLRDIILLVILSIVCGFLYRLWDWLYMFAPAQPVAQAAFNGLWLLAAVLVGVIVRRPGAALLAELIAAIVELAFGSNWGLSTVLSGLIQGLGAEIGFAVFAYKKYNVGVALLAGALSGVAFLPQWWTAYQGSSLHQSVQIGYMIVTIVSGAILGGWLPRAIAAAMNRTGVLRNYAIGRQTK